jgi:hypothetical protein
MKKVQVLMCFVIILLFFQSTLIIAATNSEQSLVSLSSGAFLIEKPAEYSLTFYGFYIMDEDPETGWCSPEGEISDHTFVFELAEETILHHLEFDTAYVDTEYSAAKDIIIELSNEGLTEGFQEIARLSLIDQKDKQKFPVSNELSGRWLRLTILNNHGSTKFTELMDFRAYGEQLTETPLPDVSGTYTSDYHSDFHLLHQGTSLTGCYEWDEGLLNGTFEGRMVKLTWEDSYGKGPGILVFSSDGERFFGLWWYEGNEDYQGEMWEGVKQSQDIGSCPHWGGGV